MRNRHKLYLTLDDQTRVVLHEMSDQFNLSKSKVVSALAGFWYDITFEKEMLPLVNALRKRLGKEPLDK